MSDNETNNGGDTYRTATTADQLFSFNYTTMLFLATLFGAADMC